MIRQLNPELSVPKDPPYLTFFEQLTVDFFNKLLLLFLVTELTIYVMNSCKETYYEWKKCNCNKVYVAYADGSCIGF